MVKIFLLILLTLGGTENLFSFPIVSGDISKPITTFFEGNLAKNIYSEVPLCDAALVIGNNGTAVLIPSYVFEMITLTENGKGWNLTSKNLPPVCNIRNIKKICLQQIPAKYSIQIIENMKTKTISPFMFIIAGFDFIGESTKNGFTVKKYKQTSKVYDWGKPDKVILTSGEEKKCHKVTFKNYYFSCSQDTIKKVIMKSEVKK